MRLCSKYHQNLYSKKDYEVILNNIQDYAIFTLTPKGNIQSWNAGAKAIKGYEKKEVVGKYFSIFYTPKDRTKNLPKQLLKIAQKQGKYQGEGWRVRKDGSFFWAKVLIQPIYNSKKKLLGFIKITSDLTKQHQLEEEKNKLVAIIEESIDFISSADLEGNLLYINKKGKSMVGLPHDFDVTQLKISDMHPSWASKIVEEEGIPTTYKKGTWKGENALLHRNGKEIAISQVIILHRDKQGKPNYLSTIIRDISEQKSIEQQLEASHLLNETILSSAKHIMVATDQHGVVIVYNKAAEKAFGYKPQEVVNKKTPLIWHDHDELVKRANVLTEELGEEVKPGFDVFVKKITQGAMDDREWTFIRKNGTRFPGILTPTVMYNNQDELVGFLGIVNDITEEKLAQDALKNSEETFRTAMSYSAIGMAIVSNEGRWLKVNRALCNMLGYREDELLQLDFQTVTYPEDLERDLILMRQLLCKQIDTYQLEKRYLHKDGHVIWGMISASMLRHSDGSPKWIITQIQDITQKMDLELELKKEAEIVNLAHDAIIVRNLKDEITFWSQGAEATYGWTAKEALGQITHILLQTIFPEPVSQIKAKLKKQKSWEGELTHRHKTGKTLVVNSRWVVQPDVKNKQIGTLEINRDITEKIELMQKLIKSNAELERFAYVASHDLQEPIRMITNFSQLIVQSYSKHFDKEAHEYLQIIIDASYRMHEMIEDLLIYSRMGNEIAPFTLFDGEKTLENTLTSLQILIEETKTQITKDPFPPLYGNSIQIQRVLQNLIVNAIKYQPPGNPPKIKIRIVDQNNEWRISIKDNGIGIEKKFLEEVFQPFRRLHSWDTIKGTGLGLAICKRIVENHQGKLWATSDLGKGTTFYFTLPKH